MSATWNCRAWRMWCSCARPMPMRKSSASTPRRRRRLPGVIAIVTGAGACGRHHAVGRRALASEGPQIGAAACDRDRSRLLAGRGRRGHRGDQPRRGRGRRGTRRVEYEELEAVTDMRTALDPETPVIHPSLGDNLAFERNLDAGAVDAGVCRFRRGGGGGFHLRPAHRRDAGAARGGGRLERRRSRG